MTSLRQRESEASSAGRCVLTCQRIGGSEEELKRKELEAKTFHEEKMAAYNNVTGQAEVCGLQTDVNR